MVKHVKAVVEHGQLRLTEPLDLPEGREVNVIVRVVPTPEETAMAVAESTAAIKEAREEFAKLPVETQEQLVNAWEGRQPSREHETTR